MEFWGEVGSVASRWLICVLCSGLSGVTIDPDLTTLLLRHTAKWRSALTKLASPSSIATRCVFLYKPL